MDSTKIVGRPGIVPLIIGLYERRKEVVNPTTLTRYICNYSRLREVLNTLERMGIITIKKDEDCPNGLDISLTPQGKEVAKVLIQMEKSLQKIELEDEK